MRAFSWMIFRLKYPVLECVRIQKNKQQTKATLRVYRGVRIFSDRYEPGGVFHFEMSGCSAKNSNISPKWNHKTCVKGVAKLFSPKEVRYKSVEWLIIAIIVWVTRIGSCLGRYPYSPPQRLQLQLLTRPQSSLFGSHAERATPKGERGVMGRRKMKGRESPQASFSFLSSPLALSLESLTSLLSLVLMVDWETAGNESGHSSIGGRFRLKHPSTLRISS